MQVDFSNISAPGLDSESSSSSSEAIDTPDWCEEITDKLSVPRNHNRDVSDYGALNGDRRLKPLISSKIHRLVALNKSVFKLNIGDRANMKIRWYGKNLNKRRIAPTCKEVDVMKLTQQERGEENPRFIQFSMSQKTN